MATAVSEDILETSLLLFLHQSLAIVFQPEMDKTPSILLLHSAMGILILVYATSDILHDTSMDSPIIGALMLFAGLFNVFTMVIHLLMAFGGDD